MASSYFPSWLHLPSVSSATRQMKIAFFKPVPIGHFAPASAGALSIAYAFYDAYWYYSIPRFERGPSSPMLYIQSCIIRLYRCLGGMDGTYTRSLYKFVLDTKDEMYKRKLLKGGELPVRRGPRPNILIQGVPHRQIPQLLDPTLNTGVQDVLKSFAAVHPDTLTLGPSKVERNALALFLSSAVSPGHPDLQVSRSPISGLEFAHVHDSDNALHIALSPLDAAEAIEKGWAVRFPLSGCPVPGYTHPQGRVLLYAPRDDGEVGVVKTLVGKSMEWMMQKP